VLGTWNFRDSVRTQLPPWKCKTLSANAATTAAAAAAAAGRQLRGCISSNFLVREFFVEVFHSIFSSKRDFYLDAFHPTFSPKRDFYLGCISSKFLVQERLLHGSLPSNFLF